jgi:hypothetical protein
MKLNEITGRGKWYECRVRVVGDGHNLVLRTVVNGDSRSGVIAMMIKLYGRNNLLSCNEINDFLNEKSYGATTTRVKGHDVMNRRPFSPEQLQVKSLEKKARDKANSGDVNGSAQAKAEVALKKAQIKKNKAEKDYTAKAHKLTMTR